jgi:hypothetical protein
MHFLADFDNQTKLLHVGYSILGMLISMVVLVKLKPSIVPRMIVASLLGLVLVYCLGGPITGDQEKLKDTYSVGWFALGLLFGIGRGEFVIAWLIRKFYGAPDQIAEQLSKSEGLDQSDEAGKCGAEEAQAAIASAALVEPQSVIATGASVKAEAIASEEKIDSKPAIQSDTQSSD